MKLLSKGRSAAGRAAAPAPAFQPIDRGQLLGLLEQIVSAGQSAIMTLRDQNGTWTYAFQNGGLVHASGGRVRGARQAFDLLWEFQYGEFAVTPGTAPALGSNLYIDKRRLFELLRRSQAAFQAPGSPYIPPSQQRPIPTGPTYRPPAAPGSPSWPGVPQAPAPWGPVPYPPQPGYPGGYAPPGQVPAQLPGPPVPGPPHPGGPLQGVPGPAPAPQFYQAPPGQVMPQGYPQPQPPYVPMPVLQRPVPVPPPQAAPPPAPAMPPALAQDFSPQDDLKVLRASLVAQTPAVASSPPANAAAWPVQPAQAPAPRVQPRAARQPRVVKPKNPSQWRPALEEKTIRFLLWACERRYDPDDHWNLKDAFEVATMELRDQFMGAFSQSFKAARANQSQDDDVDQVDAGRRARGRRR